LSSSFICLSPGEDRGPATVDEEVGAGDAGGFVAGQEDGGGDHVLGRPKAAERDRSGDRAQSSTERSSVTSTRALEPVPPAASITVRVSRACASSGSPPATLAPSAAANRSAAALPRSVVLEPRHRFDTRIRGR